MGVVAGKSRSRYCATKMPAGEPMGPPDPAATWSVVCASFRRLPPPCRGWRSAPRPARPRRDRWVRPIPRSAPFQMRWRESKTVARRCRRNERPARAWVRREVFRAIARRTARNKRRSNTKSRWPPAATDGNSRLRGMCVEVSWAWAVRRLLRKCSGEATTQRPISGQTHHKGRARWNSSRCGGDHGRASNR
jgi:hypothetical protein